jgi:hypothetical protein
MSGCGTPDPATGRVPPVHIRIRLVFHGTAIDALLADMELPPRVLVADGFLHKPWGNGALTSAVCRDVDHGRAVRRSQRHATRERQEAQAIQRGSRETTAA